MRRLLIVVAALVLLVAGHSSADGQERPRDANAILLTGLATGVAAGGLAWAGAAVTDASGEGRFMAAATAASIAIPLGAGLAIPSEFDHRLGRATLFSAALGVLGTAVAIIYRSDSAFYVVGVSMPILQSVAVSIIRSGGE
jgi:hypothetical protein